MRSLARLAQSRTAAALAAAALGIVLAMGALGAFPRNPGIDFYQFWGVPLAREAAALSATPYADAAAYASVLNAMADASPSQKLKSANRERRSLEPMGTPFLYATFSVFPADYEGAQAVYTALQYAAAGFGIFLLVRLLGLGAWPAACAALFVLLAFNPFAQDVRVGNLNSIQLAVLAALIGVSSTKRFTGRPWIDGLFLGCLALLVALKPNTPWIAAALALHFAAVRGARAFLVGAFEAMLLAAAAFAIGAWKLGGAHAWTEWIALARGLDGSGLALPLERGNLSLAMLLGQATPGFGSFAWGIALAAAVILAFAVALCDAGRSPAPFTAMRGAFSDPWFAASVGILLTFASSPLVWPHYHVLLLVPIAWLVLGERRPLGFWGAVLCFAVLSRPVIDTLLHFEMYRALQWLSLLSWLALLPGVLAYAREARYARTASRSTLSSTNSGRP